MIVNEHKRLKNNTSDRLFNNDFLNRAHWVFGEGGGYFAERYAMTIDNLRNMGKTGYGPTPFPSEEAMYKATMLHGTPAKCLYPSYFNGTYKGVNALEFAMARKSKNYIEINNNPKMNACIKAVIDSLTDKTKNEGYNQWRGSGDNLYTEIKKKEIESSGTQISHQDLITAKDKRVYATVKTETDHYWEPVGNKYRRHTFKRQTIKYNKSK